MVKSFTLDGKRHALPSEVPTGQIKWLVARMHVATSDADVTEMLEKRMVGPAFTPRIRKAAIAFALKCHRDNQKLFNRFRF